MALVKRVYSDGNTVITAQNLNDIQDEIIANGEGVSDLQTDVSELQTDVGDVSQLSGFTATDLTGAANELKEALNNTVLQADVVTVSANGTTSNTLTGLTADHVVGNWGMFTDSACTTPIPENAPTCDITITTNEDEWVLVITNYSSTFYLRPTFILKQN